MATSGTAGNVVLTLPNMADRCVFEGRRYCNSDALDPNERQCSLRAFKKICLTSPKCLWTKPLEYSWHMSSQGQWRFISARVSLFLLGCGFTMISGKDFKKISSGPSGSHLLTTVIKCNPAAWEHNLFSIYWPSVFPKDSTSEIFVKIRRSHWLNCQESSTMTNA